MNTRKPPTPAPTDNGQPAKPAAGPAVIRRLTGAEETDRLVKKHLPAWVVSGAVHLVLILVLWLINAGYHTLQFTLFGLILGLIH